MYFLGSSRSQPCRNSLPTFLINNTPKFLLSFHHSNLTPKTAEMAGKGFSVDLNKPLVFQVGHLGESYQDWVHTPILTEKSPRFFESDVLEIFTRTVWWVVPVVWLPVAFYFIKMSYTMGHTLPQVAILSVLGAFLWTFHEYCFHRFLFHIDTKSYWGNTFHYLIHGCHHKHPNDGLRLVIPPAEAAVLALMFWNLYGILFTLSTRPVMFGGGLVGYVMYDMVHYYVHHGQPTKQSLKSLKKYHLNHHFRIQNKGFGITTVLWDRVFGTSPTTKAADKSG